MPTRASLLSLPCRTRLPSASLARSCLRTSPAYQLSPRFLAAKAPRAHVREDRGHDRKPRHKPPRWSSPPPAHLILPHSPANSSPLRPPCLAEVHQGESPVHLPCSEHCRPSVELLGRAPPRVRTTNPLSPLSFPCSFSPPFSTVVVMHLGAVPCQIGELPEQSPSINPPSTLLVRRIQSWRSALCACGRRTKVLTPRILGLASLAPLLSLCPLSL
jgi:hypothetical protein